MRNSFIYPLIGVTLLALSPTSPAEDGSVSITSPAEGARLDAGTRSTLSYVVVPGSRGDHTHLYLDNRQEAILRALKGDYQLPSLSPGAHDICIRVVDKGHTPTGTEKCVHVTAQ